MSEPIEVTLARNNAKAMVAVGGRRFGRTLAAKNIRALATPKGFNKILGFAEEAPFVPRISPLAWAIHITSRNLWRQSK